MSSVQPPFLSNVPYQCNSAVVCSPSPNSIYKAPILVLVKPDAPTTRIVTPTTDIEPIQYTKVSEAHFSPKLINKSAHKPPLSFKSYIPSSPVGKDEKIPTVHRPELEKGTVSIHHKQHSYHDEKKPTQHRPEVEKGTVSVHHEQHSHLPQQSLPAQDVVSAEPIQTSPPLAKVNVYEPEIIQPDQLPPATPKTQAEGIKVDLTGEKVNISNVQGSTPQEKLQTLNLLYNELKKKAYEYLEAASFLKEQIGSSQRKEDSKILKDYRLLVEDAMYCVQQADFYRKEIEKIIGASVTSKGFATKIYDSQTDELTAERVNTSKIIASTSKENKLSHLDLLYNNAYRSFEEAKNMLGEGEEISPELAEQYIQRMKNVNYYVEQAELCRKEIEKKISFLEYMYKQYKTDAYEKFAEANALKGRLENVQGESFVQLKEQYNQLIRDAIHNVEQADFYKNEIEKIIGLSIDDVDYIKFDVNIPDEDISRMHSSARGINYNSMNEQEKILYVLDQLYQQHKRDAFRSFLAANEFKKSATKQGGSQINKTLNNQYNQHIRNALQHAALANYRKQQIEERLGIKFTYASLPSEDIGWSRSQYEEDIGDKIFGKPPSLVTDSAFI